MKPQNEELWRRYQEDGDADARSQLLERHLRLVHGCAIRVAKSARHTLEVEDLVSSGTLGLLQALESFDLTRGVAFSTYAMRRIHGAILDELRGRDWMTRAGRSRVRRFAQVVDHLKTRLRRSPNHREIALALGVTMNAYWRFWADLARQRVISLSEPTPNPHHSHSLEETISGREEDPLKSVMADERRAQLGKALRDLPTRDREVLALHYYEGLNLREIGEVFNITESRVSQIRRRALERLRESPVLAGSHA